jgi:hypothetical protein
MVGCSAEPRPCMHSHSGIKDGGWREDCLVNATLSRSAFRLASYVRSTVAVRISKPDKAADAHHGLQASMEKSGF